jgi:hypothetical protein
VQLFAGNFRGSRYSIVDGLVLPGMCRMDAVSATADSDSEVQCLLLGRNPTRGQIHFDDIGAAMVSVFQVCVYVCVFVWVQCTCVCISQRGFMYIYIYTHIHLYVHTYMHKYKLWMLGWLVSFRYV